MPKAQIIKLRAFAKRTAVDPSDDDFERVITLTAEHMRQAEAARPKRRKPFTTKEAISAEAALHRLADFAERGIDPAGMAAAIDPLLMEEMVDVDAALSWLSRFVEAWHRERLRMGGA